MIMKQKNFNFTKLVIPICLYIFGTLNPFSFFEAESIAIERPQTDGSIDSVPLS